MKFRKSIVTAAITLSLSGLSSAGVSLVDSPTFQGDLEFEQVGMSVSGIGDVNADGYDDYIIGAPRHVTYPQPVSPGNAYVVFGTADGIPMLLKPSDLNGQNGFRIIGYEIGDQFGHKVAGLGDVNGDGISDFSISAVNAFGEEARSGNVYVIYGNSDFGRDFYISQLNGVNGFTINGPLDRSVARIGYGLDGGDINNDGLADIAIGAPYSSPEGRPGKGSAWVVYGQENRNRLISLEALSVNDGFRIDGEAVADNLGWSLSFVGDANGDGFQDLLIGAPRSDSDADRDSGSAYLLHGNATFPSVIETSHFDGYGTIFKGHSRPSTLSTSGERFGTSVAGIGDFNSDGLSDFAIGAPNAEISEGRLSGASYVLYGSRNFPSTLSMDNLEMNMGARFVGSTQDMVGSALAGGADIDGDGIDDLIIGAPTADPTIDTLNGAGEAYIVFGSTTPLTSPVVLKDLENTTMGMVLQGTIQSETAATSLSIIGDANNDGFADALIGAPARTTHFLSERRLGAAYLFYGADFRGLANTGTGCPYNVEEIIARLQTVQDTLTLKNDVSISNKIGAVVNMLQADNIKAAAKKLSHDLLNGKARKKLCTAKKQGKDRGVHTAQFCDNFEAEIQQIYEALLCLLKSKGK